MDENPYQSPETKEDCQPEVTPETKETTPGLNPFLPLLWIIIVILGLPLLPFFLPVWMKILGTSISAVLLLDIWRRLKFSAPLYSIMMTLLLIFVALAMLNHGWQ